MANEYPEAPRVGVGAVVWRGSRILLVKRAHAPGAGEWSLPGGRLELGETVQQGAEREVMEETGIQVRARRPVWAVDSIERDDNGQVRFHYTIVNVLAEWVTGEGVAGDDAAAVCWASLDDAHELVRWHATREVIALTCPPGA